MLNIDFSTQQNPRQKGGKDNQNVKDASQSSSILIIINPSNLVENPTNIPLLTLMQK